MRFSGKAMPMMAKISVRQDRCCTLVKSGYRSTHYRWNSGHYMVTGNGSRSVTYWVWFKGMFNNVPRVNLSLAALDVDKNKNLRVNLSVAYVD